MQRQPGPTLLLAPCLPGPVRRYGSYDPDMQTCPVFQGLFAVARRFYLLFQQHTTDEFNAKAREFLTNDGS